MNITVKIDEVTIDTVVGEVVAFDEEGDPYRQGERTVADIVAEQIMKRLLKDDGYPRLAERVAQIRTEEIREAVKPLITEAITRPIRSTNSYGEAVGPETTLSALIAAEARAMLAKPVDAYSRSGQTVLGKIVAEEVATAFRAEVAGAPERPGTDLPRP